MALTDLRIYVAEFSYDFDTGLDSNLRVVDLSAGSGALTLGPKVPLAGAVRSSAQMDEYQGVLRVLSQPWPTGPAVVETFHDEGGALTALGNTALQLNAFEGLQSLTFDAARLFTLTTYFDVLTFDLSDPARPRQGGRIYLGGSQSSYSAIHLMPSGNRLLVLNSFSSSRHEPIPLALFDVSNLDAPRLLDTQAVGGSLSLDDGQERILQGFRVEPEASLLLVPFGNPPPISPTCGRDSPVDTQLVDFKEDGLALHGVAQGKSSVRRALIHRGSLLRVADDALRTFDITDRDAPRNLAEVALNRFVERTALVGGQLVRLGTETTEGGAAMLDRVPIAEANAAEGAGRILIDDVLGKSCIYSYPPNSSRLFGYEHTAYMAYSARAPAAQSTALAVIDYTNPSAPKLLANTALGVDTMTPVPDFNSVVPSGDRIVQVGTTFVALRTEDDLSKGQTTRAWLDVVDAAQKTSVETTSLSLPFTAGLTGLLVDQTNVLMSHYEEAPDQRVKFYMDWLDVTNPRAPRLAKKINVPGSLLAWDAPSQRAVVVGYQTHAQTAVSFVACSASAPGRFTWQPDDPQSWDGPGTCSIYSNTLMQVRVGADSAELEGTWDVPLDLFVHAAATGADRIYVGARRRVECPGCRPPTVLLVLSGFHTGRLAVATLDVGEGYSVEPVAFEDRVLFANTSPSDYENTNAGDVFIADAGDPRAPRLVQKLSLGEAIVDVKRVGMRAIAALGAKGARVIDVAQ